MVTAAATAEKPSHGEIRTMALFLQCDEKMLPDNVLLILAVRALSSKTLRANLDLTGSKNVVYKLRIVLRSFQEFPREFASY
jgi:hypothetical protein